MVIVVVGEENGRLESRIDEIDAAFPDAEINTYFLSDEDNAVHITSKIKELGPDLLITENLIRFEECTLTDAVAYNLIHCRQIHYLPENTADGRYIENAEYLKKQLSLVMHFFCNKEDEKQYYINEYPDIPYVEVSNGIVDDIKSVLAI